MRARNPLYVMAKPPPGVQARIAALARNDPGRGAEQLHVTLLSLFDLYRAPPEWLPAVIAALDTFEAVAFPLAFDRIENRKAVALRTSAPLPEARAFQKALVGHLLERRAPLMLGTTPEPHLTIDYHGDRLRAQIIEPIGWTVDEILLVESVVGKTTHIEHGRWPLRAGACRRVPARAGACRRVADATIDPNEEDLKRCLFSGGWQIIAILGGP